MAAIDNFKTFADNNKMGLTSQEITDITAVLAVTKANLLGVLMSERLTELVREFLRRDATYGQGITWQK